MTIDPANDQRPVRRPGPQRAGGFQCAIYAARTPAQIAEVISAAATSQPRYIAGNGAKGLLGAKAQISKADFAAMIQGSFGVWVLASHSGPTLYPKKRPQEAAFL